MATSYSWLLSNSLIVAGLFPFVWAIGKLLHRQPATVHLLWVLLLVKLVMPPILHWPWSAEDLWSYTEQPPSATSVHDVTLTESPIRATSTVPASVIVDERDYSLDAYVGTLDGMRSTSPEPETLSVVSQEGPLTSVISLDRAVSIVGGIGALFVILVLTIRVHQQLRILRATVDAPDELIDVIRHVASRLGVRPPRVAVTRRIEGPAMCCLGRPVMLWPTSMTSPRAIAESSGVLAHELAHLKRGDPWILFLELLATVVCWWNPLLWLIRRQLHETRELACDGLALAMFANERGVYARKLLNLSIAGHGPLVLAPAFGARTVSRRFLKRRLTMVFDDRVQGRVSHWGIPLALLFAVISLPSLATAFPQSASSAGASSESSNSQATAGVASQTGDLFNCISSASENAGALASTSSASADEANAATAAAPSSTSGASSSDAVSDDSRPAQRSLSRTSKVFNYDELTRTAESVIRFPNGCGLVRITTKEDGSLAVVVEEAGQNSRDVTASNMYRSSGGATSISGTSPTQSAPESSASTGTGSSTSSGVTWPTSATEPMDPTVATYPTLQVNADGEDSAMLRLNVQLAEVTVQEKQAQLDIAKKEGADDAHLRLAGLALRRAEIELLQAKIRQKRGSTAPTDSVR